MSKYKVGNEYPTATKGYVAKIVAEIEPVGVNRYCFIGTVTAGGDLVDVEAWDGGGNPQGRKMFQLKNVPEQRFWPVYVDMVSDSYDSAQELSDSQDLTPDAGFLGVLQADIVDGVVSSAEFTPAKVWFERFGMEEYL